MLPVTITLRRAAARAARYAPHVIGANNQRIAVAASVQLAHGQLHNFPRVASFASTAVPELDQEVETETDIVLEPLNGFVGQKSIEEFNFSHTLLSNLVNAEITHLFPVQAQSFQVMMDGSDIVGRSKTGSGKTMAFGLPIVEKLLNSPKSREPRALILLPTRELSMQVADAIKKIAPQLRIVNVVGGVSYTTQENQLRRGADILVGTPGRITDLVDKGSLVLDEVEVAVLDEADMMLKFGFQEAVETILGYVTKADSQTVMWSATFPKWVSAMAKKFTKNAVNIDLVGREDTHVPATVNHKAIHAPNRSRVRILENVLRHHARGGQTLIFTETKQEADQIANELSGEVRALHGDLSQGMRTSTMEGFRNGSIKTLVCTDIAARGLDIADVELVVQYRLPNDKESFVHRAGRTGRAGRSGTNLVFFDRQDAGEILDIERRYKLTFNHAAAPRVEHMLEAAVSDISKKLAGVPKEGLNVFKAAAEQMHAEQGINALSSALALLAGFDNDNLSAFSMLTGRPKMQTVEVGGVKSARDVQMVLSKVVDRVSSSEIHSVDGKFVFDIPHDSMDKLHKLFADAGAKDVTISPVVEVSRLLVSAHNARDNGGRRGFGGDRRGGNSFGGYGDRRGGGGFSSRRNYDNNRGGNRDYDSSFSFGSKRSGFGERNSNRERSFSRFDNGRQSPRSSRGSSNKSNSFLDNW